MSRRKTHYRLLETDQFEWTMDKLSRGIEETRALIERIDAFDTADRDFIAIRAALAEDVSRKEAMLAELGQPAEHGPSQSVA